MTFILNIVSFVSTITSHENRLSPHPKMFVLTLECIFLPQQSLHIKTAVHSCPAVLTIR